MLKKKEIILISQDRYDRTTKPQEIKDVSYSGKTDTSDLFEVARAHNK